MQLLKSVTVKPALLNKRSTDVCVTDALNIKAASEDNLGKVFDLCLSLLREFLRKPVWKTKHDTGRSP